MKKFLTYAVTALCLCAVGFTSCEDEEESKDVNAILTSGKWYTEAMDISVVTPFGTQTDKLEDCEKDDYVEFKTNGTMVEVNGPNKCEDDDEEENSANTWKLADSNKTLIITEDGMEQKFTITSISDTKMSLKIDQSITEQGITITIKGTIKVYKK